MAALPLELKDTFGEWRNKINMLVDNVNITPFSISSYSGLSIDVRGGLVRDGSEVESLDDINLPLFASKTNILAIYKKPSVPAEILVYDLDFIPEEFIIPLYSITTNGTESTSIVDLRTSYNTSSAGAAGSASGVLQFDKLIEEDVDIRVNQNGLSIDPTVGDGVTVNVSPGSVWVVL